MLTREKFITEALKYENVAYDGIFYNAIINGYNSIYPLPRTYKITNRSPWCAAFVSYIGYILKANDVILPECSCTQMIKLYQDPKIDRFIYRSEIEDNGAFNHIKEGDLVFYNWDGDNTADHVGIIVARTQYGESDSQIILEVLEGNVGGNTDYNGSIRRRKIPITSSYVWGFATPNFSETNQDEASEAYDWCLKNEIFIGDEQGYRWEEPLTRGEAAIILRRFYERFC